MIARHLPRGQSCSYRVTMTTAVGVPPSLEDAQRASDAIGAADPNVTRVMVFGSVSRGDARPESDINLMVLCSVVGEEERQALLVRARRAAGEAVPERKVDITVREVPLWEHFSARVSASFDALIQPDLKPLFSRSGELCPHSDYDLGDMPRDNADVAADWLEMSANHLWTLAAELRSVPGGIALRAEAIAEGHVDLAEDRRVGDLENLVADAQMSMALAIRSVAAAAHGINLAQEFDFDRLLARLPGPDGDLIAAALDPLREGDGSIPLLFDPDQEHGEPTPDLAARHVEAAVEVAGIAAGALQRVTVDHGRADAAAGIALHQADQLSQTPRTSAYIATGEP